MEEFSLDIFDDNSRFILKYLEKKNNHTIINNNIFIKSVRFIYLIITGFVNIFSHSLSLMINAKFIKAIASIITYGGICIGIIVAVLQLIKWWKTGQI